MVAKKRHVTKKVFADNEATLRQQIKAAIEIEIADCAIPNLAQDPATAGVWGSMPTVDSKTAHKISASVVEKILDCEFQPKWIRRGGYSSVEDAVAHVLDQLRTHCVEADVSVTA